MLLPKPQTPRNPKFLAFVRSHDCCVCGWPAHLGMESHHVETGGMGIKCSDYESVPLCPPSGRGCHAKADKSPETAEKFRPVIQRLQSEWAEKGGRLPSP